MATIVKEFTYTGTLKIGKLPAGVSSMDIYLWGGAGGSGGSDYSGDGSDGAAGHYIEAKGINTSAYAGRKNIVINWFQCKRRNKRQKHDRLFGRYRR